MKNTYQVLVFDDDRLMGKMTEDIALTLGYTCRHYLDGRRALERIKEARPALLILDIMMPGMDGLSLCRLVRTLPTLKDIKILVMSGKTSPDERQRALKAGADEFLPKPYDVLQFKPVLCRLAGKAAPAAPDAGPSALKLKVWGCWGVSKKLSEKSVFGDKTSCVSLQTATGELIILDGGTGLVPCSQALERAGLPAQATILLTHYHCDHIVGLVGHPWVDRAGLTLNIAGPQEQEMGLENFLTQQVVRGRAPKAKLVPVVLYEDAYQVSPAVKVNVMYANHPTTTLAFSVETGGRKVVYCPDSGLPEEEGIAEGDYEEKLVRFIEGADAFIHSAQLTPQEAAEWKTLGHSSWRGAMRVAAAGSARRLVLFHHDPAHSDDVIRSLYTAAQEAVEEEITSLECLMACDGMSLEL